jgi:hypothetical protein
MSVLMGKKLDETVQIGVYELMQRPDLTRGIPAARPAGAVASKISS